MANSLKLGSAHSCKYKARQVFILSAGQWAIYDPFLMKKDIHLPSEIPEFSPITPLNDARFGFKNMEPVYGRLCFFQLIF